MNDLLNRGRVRSSRLLWLQVAAPLALSGLLLAGCSGAPTPAEQPGSTSQEGGSTSDGGNDTPAEGTDDGGQGGGEVDFGDVKVGTQIPEEFPADFPLPAKSPTSVVTVGEGFGVVGGGVALNYDGLSKDEIQQMLDDAESAGYVVTGPFTTSGEQWGLKKGKVTVLALYTEQTNLSLTVTTMP